jgi:hypothetical protein
MVVPSILAVSEMTLTSSIIGKVFWAIRAKSIIKLSEHTTLIPGCSDLYDVMGYAMCLMSFVIGKFSWAIRSISVM